MKVEVTPLERNLITELHEFDGHENISIAHKFPGYGFLVHFDVNGYKMSSYDIIDHGGEYAESIHVCQRKHEADLIKEVENDIEQFEQEAEIEEVNNQNDEYVIQSNNEEYDDGSWKNSDRYLDNVDIHRWFDDHEGEIWEH